jgi:Flp pilus assembly protein TadD
MKSFYSGVFSSGSSSRKTGSKLSITIGHALEIDPNNVDARYVYALLPMALGRLPEATTQIQHAALLDPLSAQVHSTFGRILYRARRLDEAVQRVNRAIDLEPRNAVAYARLGDVYDQVGKLRRSPRGI